ncbi:MAG: DUF4911 domain-containing protein [Desulfohalobiaceae bacterium]
MPAREKKPAPCTPPRWSQRLYLELAKKDIAFFRFLLESQDNLAYMSVVDRFTPVLKLTFSPGQAGEVEEFLESVSTELGIRLLPTPGLAAAGKNQRSSQR